MPSYFLKQREFSVVLVKNECIIVKAKLSFSCADVGWDVEERDKKGQIDLKTAKMRKTTKIYINCKKNRDYGLT